MKFEQNVRLQQKQQNKLIMTQKMQQSIQMLKFNAGELKEYLSQVELDNPFVVVSFNNERSTSTTKDEMVFDMPAKKPQSLFDYLIDQVNLTMRKTVLRDWVVYFIQNLDQNGYLKLDTKKLVTDKKIDQVTLDDALTLLWRLDPPGVGARNLQECLLLQIENERGRDDIAYRAVKEHFELFTQSQWKKIAKKLKISLTEMQAIIDFLKTLSAAPGKAYDQSETSYIAPDLIVKEVAGELVLESTSLVRPKVIFKQSYYESLVKERDKNVSEYLRQKKRQYMTLVAELEQRKSTIERVGQEILSRQYDFFTKSKHPLQPMLLRDVAQKLQLHESTISRAVNGKYLQTDFGVFELRSFFTKAVVKSSEEKQVSVDFVCERLKELIANENKKKPLSDQKLATLLQSDGLKVSRRTIAKYRETLKIASSSKRKRF